MRIIFIALLCCWISTHLLAQSPSPSLAPEADALFEAGNYDSATTLYKQAIQASLSKQQKEASLSLSYQLVECFIRSNALDKAEQELAKAQQYSQTQQFSTPVLTGTSYLMNGKIAQYKGRYDEALAQFKQAITLLSKALGDNNEKTAQAYEQTGLVYWNTGNIETALEYQSKALNIRKALYGEESLACAASYNNLGLLYVSAKPEKALEYYNRALKIEQTYRGEKHPATALAYTNIAIAYRNQSRYAEALFTQNKALGILKAIHGEQHPIIAFTYSNIALTELEQGSIEEAVTTLQKALFIYQTTYGQKHPEIASIYNVLGTVCGNKSDFAKALEYYQLALIANVREFADKNISQNPKLENIYNTNLLMVTLLMKAKALQSQYYTKTARPKDMEAALQCLQKADTLAGIIRSSLSNKTDKIAFGTTTSELYELAILSASELYNLYSKKTYQELQFYFAEKSKGAVLLDAIAESEAKHFANIPDSLVREEHQLQTDIAYYEKKIAEHSTSAEETQYRSMLLQVQRKYELLIQTLEKNYPEYYNLKHNVKPISLAELQSSLNESTTLLSFFLAEQSKRIIIFKISKTSFEIINNPQEENLGKYLSGFRNAIKFKDDNTYFTTAHALYNQLIPKGISKTTTQLLIIPDGRLGTIPFEALLSKKVSSASQGYNTLPWLLNDYAISYAFSSTLYCQNKLKKRSTTSNNMILCAPIDFQHTAQDKSLAAALNNLPATALEVKNIQDLFVQKGWNVQSYTNTDANEVLAKSKTFANCKYIHLATHGMVNETEPDLSRIFLLPDANNVDDGSLYCSELFNLQLNADLITLSACETGLGKLSKGEGIIGLTRALLYAGAGNIIVSLWSVADASTSQLMILFYQQLLQGKTKSQALQIAKQQLIQSSIKEANGQLNVYYWAPFILIGE